MSRRSVVALVVAGLGLATLGVNLSMGESRHVENTDVAEVWSEGRVRVEVLNAGGVTGMAKRATDRLRPSGFDVVQFGNAASFDPERPSAVIDRVGRTDVAQAVATRLGIDNVLSEPDPNLYVDVTVVLGREWSGPEGAELPEAARDRPWWDPRGWWGG